MKTPATMSTTCPPLTEKVDVDVLQVVHAAELVELVVHLVVDERLVVVRRVVLHHLVHCQQRNTGI